jgi:dipeptidyl-peptidase-3
LTSQSGYYLGDNAFKESEILEVQKLLNDRQIGSENTRIRKLNSSPCYQVLISSKEQHTECQTKPLDEDHLFAPEMSPAKISWRDISLVYGDNSDELAAVIEQLEHALKYAANNHQSLMIDYLIRFFTTGDIQYHKTASRHWMNDKDPIVETTFGFIETYRDPLSIRGEWRGFVAIQNKEQSRGFQRIIREAEILIRDLPWVPSNVENLGSFEEETFKVPKYTSLDSKSPKSDYQSDKS